MSGEVDDEEVYEVECLVGHYTAVDGRFMFAVKWKGYSDEQNTWESYDNLVKRAKETVWDYLNENPAAVQELNDCRQVRRKAGPKRRKQRWKKTAASSFEAAPAEENVVPTMDEHHRPPADATTVVDTSTASPLSQPAKQSKPAAAAELQLEDWPVYKFNGNLEPARILTSTKIGDRLHFVMQWTDGSRDLVLRDDAVANCPQVVISFYESQLVWQSQ